MPEKNSAKIRYIILPFLFLIGVLVFWELFAHSGLTDRIIFPALSEVLNAFFVYSNELLYHFLFTFLASVIAFLLAASIAFTLAIFFVLSKTVKHSLLPYAIGLNAIPVIALAPLVLVWFGTGLQSQIVMGILVAFFPIIINSLKGMESIEQEQLDVFKSYGATPLQILFKLRIPHSLPFVFASLKIASTFAVVGVVIGEFTGATEGLGTVIVNASYYLNTPLMFAALFLLAFWSLFFYGLIVFFETVFIQNSKNFIK